MLLVRLSKPDPKEAKLTPVIKSESWSLGSRYTGRKSLILNPLTTIILQSYISLTKNLQLMGSNYDFNNKVLTEIVGNEVAIWETSRGKMAGEISPIRKKIGLKSCGDIIVISCVTVQITEEEKCRWHILSLNRPKPACLNKQYHQYKQRKRAPR